MPRQNKVTLPDFRPQKPDEQRSTSRWDRYPKARSSVMGNWANWPGLEKQLVGWGEH